MPLPAKSILWVDDEADLLESHRIFLRDKGYEVDSATNADDAVEMLRRRPYGLVLLDEQMPGKRGLEAFRELRDVDPALPIVMVTKSEEDTTMREAIGVNVSDYLVKPINPRQVLTVVTRILEGPQIRQQAVARQFVERFRELQNERDHALDWRRWIERYGELSTGASSSRRSARWGSTSRSRGCTPTCDVTSPHTSVASIPDGCATWRAIVRPSRSTSSENSSCRFSSESARRCSWSSTACASTSGVSSCRCSPRCSRSRPRIISRFFPPPRPTRGTRSSAG